MGWEQIVKGRIGRNSILVKIIDESMTREPRTARDILQDIKPRYKHAPTATQLSAYLKLNYQSKQGQIYRYFWKK